MSHQHIDELLADPIIQMVMKADHVEPQALKGLVARAAVRRPARGARLQPGERAPARAGAAGASPEPAVGL